MSVEYKLLLNDPQTHVVTMRFSEVDSFRDEAFDLNAVVPGAALTFEMMNLPFDYDAALAYLNRMLDAQIAGGYVSVVPPGWPADTPYTHTVPTTPAEFLPEPDPQMALPLDGEAPANAG